MDRRGFEARRILVGLLLATIGLTSLLDVRSYTLLVLCLAMGSVYELVGLIDRVAAVDHVGGSLVAPVAYVGTAAYIIFAAIGILPRTEGTLLALTTLTCFAWAIFGQRSGYLARVGATLLAVLYLGKLFSYFIAIRRLGDGLDLSLLLILIIAATDIFAMITGRLWGRHFLTSISPKKTIEGSIGGLVCAIGTALVFQAVTHLSWPWWQCAAIAALTSTAAQLGDLVESALKRDALVKDAGSVFPGHGGVLDRFDSYLFGGIAFYAGLFVTGHLSIAGGNL